MSTANKKMLVVEVAGLGYDLTWGHGFRDCGGLVFRPLETVFPAVTCVAQASFRTAALPSEHGVVGNGFFDRELRRAFFWEQSSALVRGARTWADFRRRGGRVAMLFWQQSLGEEADIVISPAPVHTHGGGMIESCASDPPELYERLCRAVGRKFRLRHYWGPLASAQSSAWIAEATAALLRDADHAPDLCLTYLPALDYDLQRFGPAHPRAREAMEALRDQLTRLVAAAREAGYEVVVFGDYAIASVTNGAACPNLALRKAGLLRTRVVNGMQYPDFHRSDAFAVADHEVAHVYARGGDAARRAADVLAPLRGVVEILDGPHQERLGVRHARGGELLLVAADGFWFAYPWWESRAEAPDYAAHVDIHSKPGFDPGELFFGRTPFSVSLDTARVRGTHGRAGPDRRVAWASTVPFDPAPDALIGLAAAVGRWLQ